MRSISFILFLVFSAVSIYGVEPENDYRYEASMKEAQEEQGTLGPKTHRFFKMVGGFTIGVANAAISSYLPDIVSQYEGYETPSIIAAPCISFLLSTLTPKLVGSDYYTTISEAVGYLATNCGIETILKRDEAILSKEGESHYDPMRQRLVENFPRIHQMSLTSFIISLHARSLSG